MEDLRLEVYLRRLEGVFGREHEEELEGAALNVAVSSWTVCGWVRGEYLRHREIVGVLRL